MSIPDNIFDNMDEVDIEEALKSMDEEEGIVDENVGAEIVPLKESAMETMDEEESDENEAVVREYIRSKYASESVIPKEIFKLYPELTEQEI